MQFSRGDSRIAPVLRAQDNDGQVGGLNGRTISDDDCGIASSVSSEGSGGCPRPLRAFEPQYCRQPSDLQAFEKAGGFRDTAGGVHLRNLS